MFAMVLTAGCAAAAVAAAVPGRGSDAERRLTGLWPPGALTRHDDGHRPAAGGRAARRSAARAIRGAPAAALLAGIACAVVVGGIAGPLVGAAVAFGCHRLCSKLEPRSQRRRRGRIVADLPVAIDLLAACLRAGGSWQRSVAVVADAIGGPLGEELHGVAARVRLGADPAGAWLTLSASPALAPLARTAARACDSGAAMVPTLVRLAQDQRRAARAEAMARAREAGIRAAAPLGLCFLPAFVLLGIVPAIAGIAKAFVLP